MTEQCL